MSINIFSLNSPSQDHATSKPHAQHLPPTSPSARPSVAPHYPLSGELPLSPPSSFSPWKTPCPPGKLSLLFSLPSPATLLILSSSWLSPTFVCHGFGPPGLNMASTSSSVLRPVSGYATHAWAAAPMQRTPNIMNVCAGVMVVLVDVCLVLVCVGSGARAKGWVWVCSSGLLTFQDMFLNAGGMKRPIAKLKSPGWIRVSSCTLCGF